MSSSFTSCLDPALQLRKGREAIASVLASPEARRANGAPFSATERRFLQLVVLPLLEQVLDRLQRIRISQEEEQWQRYAVKPPSQPRPLSEG